MTLSEGAIFRRAVLFTCIGYGGAYLYYGKWRAPRRPVNATTQTRRPPPPWIPPTRQEMQDRLRASTNPDEDAEFDLLIVGGGATGAGVAVDAATRGLRVALVERGDFSSETSSKSTKLVHGGVRYLQKAVMELDYEQYKLVKEALHERKIFLQTAPYLSHSLPIMLPLYKWWQLPYYWAGCKMYDILAGEENMESSYLMGKGKALEAFPMLKSEGLVGAVVYYDGQHNDSRMNVALIMTAVRHGATVANYTEVTALHKDDKGKLQSATVRDNLTGKAFKVKAKGIINATGPFCDALLSMASSDPKTLQPIVQPSSGVHITLPNYYSPRSLGLLDPRTSDGRVIFFLPWQGNTIAGTTDSPAAVESNPVPREEDIQWILEEIRNYLSPDIKVRRGDVLSAWSGLRPLVRDPNSTETGTAGLVRNHLINVSDEGLLTIAGGKWTTYREMAKETVDRAIRVFSLRDRVKGGGRCITERVRLVGSDGWSPNMFISLIQRFGLDTDVAKHLALNYGDRAWTVCSYMKPTNERWPQHGIRINPLYPFVEGEIRYAVHHEYAQTAIDFLSRRSRLSFLNASAALDALPKVIQIMGDELGWSSRRRREEHERATGELLSMGIQPSQLDPLPTGWGKWLLTGFGLLSSSSTKASPVGAAPSRAIFMPKEVDDIKASFIQIAGSDAASISKSDLHSLIKGLRGFDMVKDKQIDYVLREAGLQGRTNFDCNEFLEVCGGLKEVVLLPGAFSSKQEMIARRTIPVGRSGGGV